jgi:hypothetical protein
MKTATFCQASAGALASAKPANVKRDAQGMHTNFKVSDAWRFATLTAMQVSVTHSCRLKPLRTRTGSSTLVLMTALGCSLSGEVPLAKVAAEFCLDSASHARKLHIFTVVKCWLLHGENRRSAVARHILPTAANILQYAQYMTMIS